MAKKRKGNYKKSPAQLHDYRSFVSNSPDCPSGTIPTSNEMLQGSADYGYEQGKLEPPGRVKRTPLKYRVLDWLKENVFAAIVVAILTAIGAAVFSHQIQLAVINKQIEYIDMRIERIEEDYVGKEILQLRMKEIKSDLESSYLVAFNDIKWQLDEIEDELQTLK